MLVDLTNARKRAVRHVTALLRAEIGNRSWYQRPRPSKLDAESYERIKRLLDVSVCLIILPVVAAMIAIMAVAIKLDSPGPVLFHQVRTGKGGRRFKMYKMRTMVQNAEKLKGTFQHMNALHYPDFKIRDDPRVTRVGRFLRKTSLDELPQIFNVLKGDMSLVGPRPTSFSVEHYQTWHTERLTVRPGITGLWQVCGRNKLQFDERLRLDIAYIRNRCLTLDLKILLRTILCVFTMEGAN